MQEEMKEIIKRSEPQPPICDQCNMEMQIDLICYGHFRRYKCPKCGIKVTLWNRKILRQICKRCGSIVPDDREYCLKCFTKVEAYHSCDSSTFLNNDEIEEKVLPKDLYSESNDEIEYTNENREPFNCSDEVEYSDENKVFFGCSDNIDSRPNQPYKYKFDDYELRIEEIEANSWGESENYKNPYYDDPFKCYDSFYFAGSNSNNYSRSAIDQYFYEQEEKAEAIAQMEHDKYLEEQAKHYCGLNEDFDEEEFIERFKEDDEEHITEKVEIEEVSGARFYLPKKLKNHPKSLLFTAVIKDSFGNVGECGIVVEKEDSNNKHGLFFYKRSFSLKLEEAINNQEDVFSYRNHEYQIIVGKQNAIFNVIEGENQEQEEALARMRDESIEYLKGRGVKYLVHFTPIENLAGIIKYGICPKPSIPSDVKVKCFDSDRYDNQTDCSSLSVMFPSYQQLFSKMQNNPGQSFAIIFLNVDALYSVHYNNIFFHHDNAARGVIDIELEAYDRHGITGCEHLFGPYEYNSAGKKVFRTELNLPDCLTTHPQAEIMVRGKISPDNILRICVKDREDYNNAVQYVPPEYINKLIVNRNWFKPRKDYVYWRKNRG